MHFNKLISHIAMLLDNYHEMLFVSIFTLLSKNVRNFAVYESLFVSSSFTF